MEDSKEGRVYARNLRDMGIEIKESIPDCAWVPWGSIRMDVKMRTINIRVPDMDLELTFEEPFRWYEIKGTISLDTPTK